ncbi:hypothetical protein [Daejeonella sp.]|uniref:hypothetical protein n=1 Tax=Daejeonella sp. TaxID=2805397 RepID=UPI0039833F75
MERLNPNFFLVALWLTMISCGKDPIATTTAPPTPAPVASTVGSLASYKKIPLPLVVVPLIIPNLSLFHVTNRGPYIQILDNVKKLWSVHKYHGSGSPEWSSFTPNYPVFDFIPSKFTTEKDREFSIYWNHTNLSDDKYGMYNLNNGSPSFEYLVPGDPKGPGRFVKVIPARNGFQRLWGIGAGNEIWSETAVAVPKTFEKIVPQGKIPIDFSSIQSIATGALKLFFADPDQETVLWCANARGLFKVGTVGSTAGSSPGILSQWNFGTISSTDVISAIIKADNNLIVQFGKKIYKLDGNTLRLIGTLNLSGPGGVFANIATSGSTIYASDGTYYDSNSNSWKSFIGTGLNLTGADATKYAELKAYASGGLTIGVLNGSSTGPVYFLTPTELIQISPIL